jgi:hypothetical protein
MATASQPMPDQQGQGAAPAAGAGAPPASPDQGAPDQSAAQQPGTPSQAPANPMQMLLARWYQTVKQMAASDPRLASGAEKISQGIQEMQTALVSPPQPTPVSQQPQY